MPRGSQPGERRGGRQKGTPNKATAEIKDLVDQYVPAAVVELARLATEAESEAGRVAAIKELLDRRYGKSKLAVDVDANVKAQVNAVEWRVIDPAAEGA